MITNYLKLFYSNYFNIYNIKIKVLILFKMKINPFEKLIIYINEIYELYIINNFIISR